MLKLIESAVLHNGLVAAFAVVGIVIWVSGVLSRRLTFGHVHGSAIAIVIGLALAYWGGIQTGGTKGLADVTLFSGIGLMGGAMLRDFAIVATAFEVQVDEARKAGMIGVVALLLGTVLPFVVGASVAYAFGYSDAVSMTTIGAGAVTYIVGPVTGAAIGASSDVMALSIATGLIKAIMVMVGTPIAARFLGLKTPRSAMVFGGLAGTVSGVSAGLAATDRKLVPYGALVATFHTGIGCLLGPSVLFLANQGHRRLMAHSGLLAVGKADTMKPLQESMDAACHGPHDLLWATSRIALISDEALPGWAQSGRFAHAPVVVRRAKPAQPGLIPVGLRGETRSQRFPAFLHLDAVLQAIRPEALARTAAWENRLTLRHFGAIVALTELAPSLDATGLCWGPTGSAGYALVTGLPVLHPQSDLDLVIRAPAPLTAVQGAILRTVMKSATCRVDMQIDTGRCAFSFAEWASKRGRVLVKTDTGPLLVGDPWESGEQSR